MQLDADALLELLDILAHVESQHADGAAAGLSQSLDALDRRLLARAVRAEQLEDFSGMDAEAQSVHRGGAAVALEELLDLAG